MYARSMQGGLIKLRRLLRVCNVFRCKRIRRAKVQKNTPILYPQGVRSATLLSKIGEGEIDNQWFKWVKMTIVPRPSHGVCKRVPRPFEKEPLFWGKWRVKRVASFGCLC